MQDVELVYIETEDFTFIIKGPPVHPDIEQLYPENNDSAPALLQVNSMNTKLKEFLHFTPEGKDLKEYQSEQVFPCFYEWQDYEVIIQGNNNKELEFYHQHQQIREAVTPLSRDKSILTGKINFHNDVGYSELKIRHNKIPLLALKIEVFPSKIDYKTDYYNLLQEVNQEVYNLAYNFLRKTFQTMELKEAEHVSHSEFFTILEEIFSNFKKAFNRIKDSPYHRLQEINRVKPASKVKQVSKKSKKWLRKNPRFYDRQQDLPVKMLDVEKKVNFNTFENKFIKWMIQQIQKRVEVFIKEYKQTIKNVEADVIDKARKIKNKLDFMLTRTFLQEVGELHKIDSLSLVLQMASGYREVYKYYLMLKKGLSISEEVFNLSIKETWELYEYWCFLKLNQILRKEYDLVKSSLIDVDYSGIYVTLNKSSTARVKYKNPRTGEKFELSYNTLEGDRVTTGQRPNNILSLKKENSNIEYKFVFDAKYRINPAYSGTSYHNKYGIPGPEEDTINTMHRYRDAIVHQQQNDFKRAMVGAYVLFPYHDEERFSNHQFYRSIDQVNVGAFPFLPGSTELISEFLADLIEETSISNYERNLLPQGTQEYQAKMDFEQNVLVGSLSTKQQLQSLLRQKFYHIPCQRVKLEEHQLDYIAIYLSKKKFPDNYGVKYYGKIKSWKVKKRKGIDLTLTKDNGEEPYYVFNIEEWQEIDDPILPEGYGISGSHIYTNDMLLSKAKTLPELSIKTLEEWRIWLELSRLKEELKVIVDKKLDPSTEVDGFKINDVVVEVNSDELIVQNGQKFRKEFKDFLRNPRGIMKDIF